ncbi:hypothetical protein Tco_0344839, partial [Tanacetum coccineum]
ACVIRSEVQRIENKAKMGLKFDSWLALSWICPRQRHVAATSGATSTSGSHLLTWLPCWVRGNRLSTRKQAQRLARESRRLARKARWLARAPNQSLASSRRPRGSSWFVDRECSNCHLAGPRIGYPEALIANHLWRLVGKKTEIPLNC